jgi:hypothetical protein
MKSIVILCVFLFSSVNSLKEEDCEVCVKFLTKFKKTLEDEGIEKEPQIKARLQEVCQKSKGRDNKFCYYIGGTDDAATRVLGEVSKPMSNFYPVVKICEKLQKKIPGVCDLKYEKQIDWSAVDISKMRVKQLKKILSDWEEECRGCLEKQDFIDRINELKPKYVKEEL